MLASERWLTVAERDAFFGTCRRSQGTAPVLDVRICEIVPISRRRAVRYRLQPDRPPGACQTLAVRLPSQGVSALSKRDAHRATRSSWRGTELSKVCTARGASAATRMNARARA